MYRYIIVSEDGLVSTGDSISQKRCWNIFLDASDYIFKAILQKEGPKWIKITATSK